MTGNIPLLRVRGLPFTAEEDQIAEFFDEYNINCIKLIKRNGKPTGEAYIEFKSVEDAQKAITEKQHQNLDQRYIELFEAAEAARISQIQHSSSCSSSSSSSSSSKTPPKLQPPSLNGHVLRLRGLPFSCSGPEVHEFFHPTSSILGGPQGIIFTCTPDGRPSGECYVEFSSEEDLERAMEKDREKIGSRYVEIFSSSKDEMYHAAFTYGFFITVESSGSSGFGDGGEDGVRVSHRRQHHTFQTAYQQHQHQHQRHHHQHQRHHNHPPQHHHHHHPGYQPYSNAPPSSLPPSGYMHYNHPSAAAATTNMTNSGDGNVAEMQSAFAAFSMTAVGSRVGLPVGGGGPMSPRLGGGGHTPQKQIQQKQIQQQQKQPYRAHHHHVSPGVAGITGNDISASQYPQQQQQHRHRHHHPDYAYYGSPFMMQHPFMQPSQQAGHWGGSSSGGMAPSRHHYPQPQQQGGGGGGGQGQQGAWYVMPGVPGEAVPGPGMMYRQPPSRNSSSNSSGGGGGGGYYQQQQYQHHLVGQYQQQQQQQQQKHSRLPLRPNSGPRLHSMGGGGQMHRQQSGSDVYTEKEGGVAEETEPKIGGTT